jgi:hypothetical protein
MESLAPRALLLTARPAPARAASRCESGRCASSSGSRPSVAALRLTSRRPRVRAAARFAAVAGPETETEGSPLDFPEARAPPRQAVG